MLPRVLSTTMSSDRVTLDETLAVFDRLETPSEPVTATEVAERLECGRRTAYNKLDKLQAGGDIRSKKVGARSRVWWRPTEDANGADTDRGSSDRGSTGREVELLDRVLEISPVGIVVVESTGEITLANRRAEEILQLERSEITNRTYVQPEWNIYDEDGDPVSEADHPVTRALESGDPVFGFEHRIDLSDGTSRWLSSNSAPLENEAGEVERVVVGLEDITELKTQARHLQRQRDELEAELDEMFERIDDGFLALDNDFQFTYVNDRAEKLLDISESDVLGRDIRDAVYISEAAEAAYTEALETQEPVTFVDYYDPLDEWIENQVYPSETGLSLYFRDISEQKRREQQLERYETIVETVEDGVYALDADERFVMVNDAFCAMTGYDREELLGEHAAIVHSERINEQAAEMSESVTDDMGSVTLQLELQTKDGGTIPVESRFGPYRYGTDEVARTGVVRDITDRKQFEETLAALHESSRELLQLETADAVAESVLRTTTDVLGIPGAGIYLASENETDGGGTDEDATTLRPVAVSEYVEELFGDLPTFGPGDEAITWRAFADRETVTFDDVTETDLTYRDDTPLRSGIWIPLGDHGVLAVVSEEVDAFGPDEQKLADLLAATTEAALDRVQRERQRRQHARELEASEQRYRTLVEHFPNGAVSLFDRDLRYVVVGGQVFEDLGMDTDAIEGRTVGEQIPEEARDSLIPKYRAALDGETSSFELEYEDRVFQARVLPVRDAADEITAGMVMTQDITEQKQRQRELEERNERLDNFASMLAHELRNPVTIGQIYSRQLSAEKVSGEAAGETAGEATSEAVEYVAEAFDRIENIIDVMLLVTRGQKAVDERQSVRLGEVVEDAWADVDAPDATLAATIDAEVEADGSYVRHLFRNLFENAVEHGGRDVTVTVGELPGGFFVADDGRGIPTEERDTVFDSGYTSAASQGGMGLGLAFVRELAAVYDWTVSVTESEGGGARFEFTNVGLD
jgi:PAS domain S-box-containing protein